MSRIRRMQWKRFDLVRGRLHYTFQFMVDGSSLELIFVHFIYVSVVQLLTVGLVSLRFYWWEMKCVPCVFSGVRQNNQIVSFILRLIISFHQNI